ncbi:hypothetical protein BDW22DRAFT_1351798 [Trametopsis cervina]|nr:hypothetical protein BDW22DRAFT_1351798 [Trametopsis cervina]
MLDPVMYMTVPTHSVNAKPMGSHVNAPATHAALGCFCCTVAHDRRACPHKARKRITMQRDR